MKNSRVAILLLVLAPLLVSCAPSEADVQAAVSAALDATAAARPAATATAAATATPAPTETASPTNTPTLRPTRTPSPTATPWPTMEPELVAIGRRCVDEITNDSYLFVEGPVNAIWTRTAPTLFAFVDESGEDYTFLLQYAYQADDWLFIDELIFNADGEVIRVPVTDVITDVIAGGILEFGAIRFRNSELETVQRIVDAEEVNLRYSGSEGQHDATLDEIERAIMKYTLHAYRALEYGGVELGDFTEGCPGE